MRQSIKGLLDFSSAGHQTIDWLLLHLFQILKSLYVRYPPLCNLVVVD